jgi:hypothetical protein
VASGYNAKIKELIRNKLTPLIAAETDPTKKAALQQQLDASQQQTFHLRLESVYRTPRHNRGWNGSPISNHVKGEATDLSPEPAPRTDGNNPTYFGLTYHEVWCSGLFAVGPQYGTEVLNERPGEPSEHIPCTGYTGYNHVHVGNRFVQ